MQTYIERATTIACEAEIVCQVLLSRGNDDIELIPLKPHAYPDGYMPPAEFTARHLRAMGFVGVGICGLQTACVFKEPLGVCRG
jgi:hypothetical protein